MGDVVRLDVVGKEYEAARRLEARAKRFDPKTAGTLRLYAGELRRRAGARTAMHGSEGRQSLAAPWAG